MLIIFFERTPVKETNHVESLPGGHRNPMASKTITERWSAQKTSHEVSYEPFLLQLFFAIEYSCHSNIWN